MKTYEVKGTYGGNNTPCVVFVAVAGLWGQWYCVEGSQNVNFTTDPIPNGVNVEELPDLDCFTWSSPILSLEDLENAVEN